jgi:hypothetical protein
LQPNANCYSFGISYTQVFLSVSVDRKTICVIPIILILATGIPTALAAHNPAYLYGFGLGKKAGLREYYDIMGDCSYRANATGAIKQFTLQAVNACDSGYNSGLNKYCHIGLTKHPDTAASCPITPG